MGPAWNPSGSFQVRRVARPESPGFFQYVCHSGSMRRRRPAWKGRPAAMDSTSATSSGWACLDAGAAAARDEARAHAAAAIRTVRSAEGSGPRIPRL